MLTCKQVAKALAETAFDDLSIWRRRGLKAHISLCFICGRFHKDVIQMQRFGRELARREQEAKGDSLSPDVKARIEDAVTTTLKEKG